GAEPVLAVHVPADPDARWTAALDPGRYRLLGVANGTARLAVADGVGSIVDRAQPALDAARAAGAVAQFGIERRTLAETFLALVGRPVDDPDDPAPDAIAAEVVR